MSKSPESAARRRFLVAAGVTVVALGIPLSWYRWESTTPTGHLPGPADDSPYDLTVFETLTEFLAVYFDTNLTEEDVVDLAGRLAYAIQHDSGWRAPYLRLTDLLNLSASELGADRFLDADRQIQLSAIRSLVEGGDSNRDLRIRALFSERAADTLHARKATIPHLRRLYRNSGVPWRQRGYSTWPGVPGDLSAYTRPPTGGSC